jgi:hypothetical protein
MDGSADPTRIVSFLRITQGLKQKATHTIAMYFADSAITLGGSAER